MLWTERELTQEQRAAAAALTPGTNSHLQCASDDANADDACGTRGFLVGKKAAYLEDPCCGVLEAPPPAAAAGDHEAPSASDGSPAASASRLSEIFGRRLSRH